MSNLNLFFPVWCHPLAATGPCAGLPQSFVCCSAPSKDSPLSRVFVPIWSLRLFVLGPGHRSHISKELMLAPLKVGSKVVNLNLFFPWLHPLGATVFELCFCCPWFVAQHHRRIVPLSVFLSLAATGFVLGLKHRSHISKELALALLKVGSNLT